MRRREGPKVVSGSRYFPGDERAGTAGPDGPATWPDLDREGLHLDREGLSRRTFGDGDLARELLDLFAQCLRLRPALVDGGAQSRAEALHTLSGAALAVGAVRVAHLASGATSGDLLRAIDDVVNVIRSGRPDPSSAIVPPLAPGSHAER